MELTDAVQNAIDVDMLTLASKGLLVAGGTDPTDPADATPPLNSWPTSMGL